MDKQSYIGLVLIFAVLVAFYFIQQPSEEERAKWAKYRDSIAQVEIARADSIRRVDEARAAARAAADSAVSDSVKKSMHGLIADAVEGEQKLVVLENEKIKVTLSSQGAKVRSVEIKGHKNQNGEDVRLFDGDKNKFGFTFTHNNRSFYTNDLFFTPSAVSVDADSTQRVDFVLNAGEGALTYSYTLPKDTFELGLSLSSKGLANVVSENYATIDLQWAMDMPAQEKGLKSEGMWSGLFYRYADGDVEELSMQGQDSEQDNLSVSWVAYKDQYFSSILLAHDNFSGVSVSSQAFENSRTLKHLETTAGVRFGFANDSKADFSFYFLPNDYYVLQSFEGKEFTEVLPLGWGIFGWCNRWIIIPIFKFLESKFANYGLIIFLLTLIIKLVLLPVMFTSFKSQAKMRVLKPQVDAINEKFPPEKAMERQQATMNLYKQAGVSPMGGCIPMLIQMPILIAAFRFFPAAIELRGKSFLWADDLANYDSILDLPFSIPFYGDHVSLFCLLMCAVNFVYTKITMSTQASAPGMGFMVYLMPVMLLFFFNEYPAGLCYYYLVSTLITIVMTFLIKHFCIDEAAILAKIEANKKKPQKNKSRFQQMMEEQLKKQQEQLKKQQRR